MADEAAPQNKGKSKLIIILVAVFLVIAILIGAAIFFMSKGGEEGAGSGTAGAEAMANVAPTQTNANYVRIGPIYQLDQFIVNLLTQSGRRYLKTTIGLEMTRPELQPELDSKRAVVRDTIIKILSSKSLEEVSTTRGKDKLQEEITQRLNEFLVDGKVRNIFFLDFAVQ